MIQDKKIQLRNMNMQEVSIEKIQKKAHEFARSKKSWHFHILTPQCQLNKSNKYAFILENGTDKKVYVVYSDKALMDLGKKLVQLLHGNKVIEKTDISQGISEQGKTLIAKAKELSGKKVAWHHHMLFPDCVYNDSGKWMLLLEDLENNQIYKAVSDSEPKADLQQIEPLFYAQ